MSDTIWLVIGTVGEYSDRREWVAAAYRDRTLAEAHADAAMAYERRSDVYGHHREHCWDEGFVPLANPYDAKVKRLAAYDPPDYHAAESCLLLDALPVP